MKYLSTRIPTEKELKVIKKYNRFIVSTNFFLSIVCIFATFLLIYAFYLVIIDYGNSLLKKIGFSVFIGVFIVIFLVLSFVGVLYIIKNSRKKRVDEKSYLINKIIGQLICRIKKTSKSIAIEMTINNNLLYPGFSNWAQILFLLNEKEVEMEVFIIPNRSRGLLDNYSGEFVAISLFGLNPIQTKKDYNSGFTLIAIILISFLIFIFWISGIEKVTDFFNVEPIIGNVIFILPNVLNAYLIIKLIVISILEKRIANEIKSELDEILKQQKIDLNNPVPIS